MKQKIAVLIDGGDLRSYARKAERSFVPDYIEISCAVMKQKTAVLIDGGHLRSYARKAKRSFVPDYIEKIGHARALADETIHRILYYNGPPYSG
jgi:hypothetical protein